MTLLDTTTFHPATEPKDRAVRAAVADAVHRVAESLADRVHVDVREGIVRLTGEIADVVTWRAVRQAVLAVPGVHLVADGLQVAGSRRLAGTTAAVDVAERIRPALKACAPHGHVVVQVDHGVVTLWGVLTSTTAQHETVRAAWSSPHVVRVQDRTRVVL